MDNISVLDKWKGFTKIVNAHLSADNFDIVKHVPNDKTEPPINKQGNK